MTQQIETLIDGQPFSWAVKGEFSWGSGGPLCQTRSDPFLPVLGAEGYRVIDLPAGTAKRIKERAQSLPQLEGLTDLEKYHEWVKSEADHLKIVQVSCDLRFSQLGLDAKEFTQYFADIAGVPLSPVLPILDKDVVQLRINRPGSTDYNPPHRDGSLPHLAPTLNVWIPVVGVDEATSLPILPGSHAIAEEDCWQTQPGGATLGGNPYRVPAIGRLRSGPLRMVRAPVRFGQALIFTPYLIHGLAFNQSETTTRMALEMRFNIVR
jgi:Phytanoyl-CoA dioxygenase (PhyH)